MFTSSLTRFTLNEAMVVVVVGVDVDVDDVDVDVVWEGMESGVGAAIVRCLGSVV